MTRVDVLRALGEPSRRGRHRAGGARRRPAPPSRARAGLRGRPGRQRALRRRVPRRRRRPRPPAGRGQLRRRHRRRGRRDRARPQPGPSPAMAVSCRTRSSGRRSSFTTAAASTSRPRGRSSTTTRLRSRRWSGRRSSRICYRRDFTINAMAVSLRARTSAVSSTRSAGGATSSGAPSASSTACRSSTTRPGCSAQSATRADTASRWTATPSSLARACVEMGLVGELSSARVRDELQLLLGEERIGSSVSRLAELGLARAIHPHLAADPDAAAPRRGDRGAPRAPRTGRASLAAAPRGPRPAHPPGRALRLVRTPPRPTARRRRDRGRRRGRAATTRAPRPGARAGGGDGACSRRTIPSALLLALACAPGSAADGWIVRYFEELRAVSARDLGRGPRRARARRVAPRRGGARTTSCAER